jgi:thioredoxin reductase (NADPH)
MQKNIDLLIVGGGSAGLTAAQYGARAGLKTVCVEQMAVGGQALTIDFLENYPGYTGEKTGYDLMQDMHKQAQDFGAEFIFDSITALRHNGGGFAADLLNEDVIRASAVIIATGAGHRKLDVPGENKFAGRGVSYCASCDGPFFKNKKIFVAGGGDAACDEARFLARISPDITILCRRAEFKAQRELAKRVLNDKNIKVRFQTRIQEIKGNGKVGSIIIENLKTGKTGEEAADAVFIFTGIVPETGLVTGGEVRPKLDKPGFIITDQRMETSVKGLFAAGDVRSSTFRQVVVACAEGAIAAHSAGENIKALNLEAAKD